MKKALLIGIMLAFAGAFFHFDLHQLLTLEGLKAGLDSFASWRESQPLLVSGLFFALYVTVTAFSLRARR